MRAFLATSAAVKTTRCNSTRPTPSSTGGLSSLNRPTPPSTRPTPPSTRPTPLSSRPTPPSSRPTPPSTRPTPPSTGGLSSGCGGLSSATGALSSGCGSGSMSSGGGSSPSCVALLCNITHAQITRHTFFGCRRISPLRQRHLLFSTLMHLSTVLRVAQCARVYASSLASRGFRMGVNSQSRIMYPSWPRKTPSKGLRSDSNAVNSADSLKILASGTEPGHFATQFTIIMSASQIN